MMCVKTLCLSLFLFIAIFPLANGAQIAVKNTYDLYWISYGTYSAAAGNNQFLMQIDSAGKMLRAPREVPKNFGPTISEAGPNAINLWGNNQRIVIDKNTLKVLKTVKTGIVFAEDVTHKPQQNFVINGSPWLDAFTPTLHFFGVSPTGVPNPANTWTITSRLITGFLPFFDSAGGIVSSDGRVVLWLGFHRGSGDEGFSLQRLTPAGRLSGDEKFYSSAGSGGLFRGAISNVLPSGEILVVYGEGNPEQLYIQMIDAQTTKAIGDGILVAKNLPSDSKFTIDSLGQFDLWTQKCSVSGPGCDRTPQGSGQDTREWPSY